MKEEGGERGERKEDRGGRREEGAPAPRQHIHLSSLFTFHR